MKNQIFVDMDGVLADFDRHYDMTCGRRKEGGDVIWGLVHQFPDFFSNIPPMADMRTLWRYIRSHNPIVLTGIPSSIEGVGQQKRAWVKRHLGKDIPVITCPSRDKCLYIKRRGDILIDDRPNYKTRWEDCGGKWITHVSADDTIQQLRSMGL